MRRIVLASASPRRRDILDHLGIPFEVRASTFDERSLPPSDPETMVLRSALGKALDVARTEHEAVVLGFDTAVVVDGDALGKPQDTEEAIAMLLRLGGREHEVLTAICAVDARAADMERLRPMLGSAEPRPCLEAGLALECERTCVRFGPLDRERAAAYVGKGESLDKAGAYGIQGYGCLLVESIQGCYLNVVGLPVFQLARLLSLYGIDLLAHG